jgi:hypothetical protein
MAVPERTQVFMSYCHVDGEWLTRLQIILQPLTQNQTIVISMRTTCATSFAVPTDLPGKMAARFWTMVSCSAPYAVWSSEVFISPGVTTLTRTGANSSARVGAMASTADRMAVSIAVRGRGRDDRLPDVKVIDPCDIRGAACRTTKISPHRRASTMRRSMSR